MDPLIVGLVALLALVASIICGIHIAVALGLISFAGIWIILGTGNVNGALSMMAGAAFESIRAYVYAVVPLFMLMGTLVSNSGIAGDLFKVTNAIVKKLKIRGGVAISTVLGNAVFAGVTGLSIVAAALFSKVAYPEMKKLHYSDDLSLGTIAGASVLGMLIPPSGLFIIFGILTGEAIGRLFIAGILPGLILAAIFCILIQVRVRINPALENELLSKRKNGASGDRAVDAGGAAAAHEPPEEPAVTLKELVSGIVTAIFIFLIIGGIWLGWFTPTEAAAIGCLGALLFSIARGIGFKGIWKATWDATTASAPLLFLLITGQMYGKLLALSGLLSKIGKLIAAYNLPGWAFLTFAIVIWLIMGLIMDSSTILFVTVPLFIPILNGFGYDPIWIGVVTIITVEIGLLTPPFGLCVFATKASVPNPEVTVEQIFRGSFPYALAMVAGLLLVLFIPILSTYLPSLM